jgi:hypothetical protein
MQVAMIDALALARDDMIELVRQRSLDGGEREIRELRRQLVFHGTPITL